MLFYSFFGPVIALMSSYSRRGRDRSATRPDITSRATQLRVKGLTWDLRGDGIRTDRGERAIYSATASPRATLIQNIHAGLTGSILAILYIYTCARAFLTFIRFPCTGGIREADPTFHNYTTDEEEVRQCANSNSISGIWVHPGPERPGPYRRDNLPWAVSSLSPRPRADT